MPAAAPPTLTVASSVPAGAAALVVGLTPGDDIGVLDTASRSALTAFGTDADAVIGVLTREKIKGGAGDIAALPVGGRLVLAAGLGEQTPRDFRRAGAAIVRRLKSVESAAVVIGRASDAQVRALAEGLLLGGYSFKLTSSEAASPALAITIVVERADTRSEALRVGVVTASATRLARDLANTPSSTKTPAWLAKQAVALARTSGLEARVRDAGELRAEGFGGVVAVGMGSVNPPRLIELSYRPPASTAVAGHVVLVGKGITFDSGGLSLKPNAGMIAMKTDMAAGGAVIATMSALRDLGVRVRVTGLIPAAENLPSGSAQRPSDVITQYGGTTVEVLNTDAEGRLVLADALAYADAELDPDVLIDLATLTGAISVALGKRHAGLFSADDRLVADACRQRVMTAARPCGACRWSTTTGRRSTLRWPTSPTCRSMVARSSVRARSWPPCSCANSSDADGGRISTSPASVEPTATSTRSRRVPPDSASACCCTGLAAPTRCAACARATRCV